MAFLRRALLCAALAAPCLQAQQPATPKQPSPTMSDMPGMDMDMPMPPSQAAPARSRPGMTMPMPEAPRPDPRMPTMASPVTLVDAILQHTTAGTSIEPLSTPMPMWMGHRAGWMLMLHGNAFAVETQQHASQTPTAPAPAVCAEYAFACVAGDRRGTPKLFSTNWVMPMAQRPFGPGLLTLRTMLDLEPATITARQYPELFQQGETAFGKPITDGQHPHDAVMELAALYDVRLGTRSLLSFCAAPVGDPAIGPTAYPHRLSASEDPIAALGHHQEDSTHIAFNVMTLGLTVGPVHVEESGFHGAEPTEAHWHLFPSPNGLAPDSYSTRIAVTPTRNLAAQYSWAHLSSPEALHPGEDQSRQTVSVMYNRPFGARTAAAMPDMPGMEMPMPAPATGNWSNTFVWGHTRSLLDARDTLNSFLFESLLNFRTRQFVWTRIESAARTTELLPEQYPAASPSALPELPLGHVQAYTLGYDREFRITPHVAMAPGAQFTAYVAPPALTSTYGHTPIAGQVFLRFRITQ